MGKFREAMQQAKKELQQAQNLATEKMKTKGLSDDEISQYGGKVLDENFGTRRVRLYEKGYVRVTMLALGGGSFEKIIMVAGEANVQSKTGVGRFAAGVLTLGANTLVTSNKRGGFYLTIVTDLKTHQLKADASIVGSESDIKAMYKIVNTAESLLASQDAAVAPDASSGIAPVNLGTPPDLGNELEKLSNLFSKGLITSEEFASAKAKLLS
jgi:hypothetical protein